ncbi:MAG TPA: EAL domain-containing protein, partial [Pyrinomonadaceae bacterium]|nr:EAL domain-containing protein [Pyrinomonadaceae bacterium]
LAVNLLALAASRALFGAVPALFDASGKGQRGGAGAYASASAWGFVVYLVAASLAGLVLTAAGWVGVDVSLAVFAALCVAYHAYGVYAKGGGARSGGRVALPSEGAESLRLAFDDAPTGMAILSARGELLKVNRSFGRMLGRTDEELLSSGIQDFVHADDLGPLLAGVKNVIRGGGATLSTDVRHPLKDGRTAWAHWNVGRFVAPYSDEVRLILQAQEVTERKLAEEKLLHDACHDLLTGLPNRALFIDHVKLSISRARRREGSLFAVLFLDLDRFKIINDSLGHMVGDELLVVVARRLERCVREGDTVARVGGDEFMVLLDDLQDIGEAVQVAERIQNEVKVPFNVNSHEVFTTMSIGIAPCSSEYDNPEDIMRDADTAMYRAKSLGKARHEVFDKTMHAFAVNLLQLETDLRKALDRDQFFIHFQPIVSLDTFHICGFEALVRWQHPERGSISPLDFIPVAEETGLIVAIGEWTLHESCRQMREWQREFPSQEPMFVSVNLSTKQFNQPNLIEQVGDILKETGLNPRALKLEITESAVMDNIEMATEMLRQLRALGVQLSIDDFGTGYSSLSYLHRFPIDTLKIDRSFVSQMSENNENTEIVRTIVVLAQNLGMDVVAEGVETNDQLALLRQLGCEYGQGYYFSKPVSSAEAGGIIADTRALQPVRAKGDMRRLPRLGGEPSTYTAAPAA